MFLHAVSSRHLTQSPYFLLNFSQLETRITFSCIRWTNSMHAKKGIELIHLKTQKNSAKSSYKSCVEKGYPDIPSLLFTKKGDDKRRISQRLTPFLTVVSRWADSLEALINRGEHVWTVVLLHVHDQRMNFNLVEKLQGCVFVGVSLPRVTKWQRFLYTLLSCRFNLDMDENVHENVKNYTDIERLQSIFIFE